MNNQKLVLELKLLINEVLKFKAPTDKLLSSYFRSNSKIGSKERSIFAETIYAILRNYFKLSNLILNKKLDIIIFYIWRDIIKLDKQYLQYFNINSKDIFITNGIEAKLELPNWLIDILNNYYSSDELEKIASSMKLNAPLDLRINSLKTDRNKIEQYLCENKIK